jgi:hypothetical protein
MMRARTPFVATLASIAVLAGAAPVASASIFPGATPVPVAVGNASITPGACGESRGPEFQAATGETANAACLGAGLSFIGPSIGQIASVVGPTIVGSPVIGTLIVSAGNAAGGG